jgi:hypothetical protein
MAISTYYSNDSSLELQESAILTDAMAQVFCTQFPRWAKLIAQMLDQGANARWLMNQLERRGLTPDRAPIIHALADAYIETYIGGRRAGSLTDR